MFKKNENTIGDIKGNYNQVIQIILSDGEKVVEKLGVLIDRLVNQEKKEIELLSQNIDAKEEALKDKRKIIETQDVEIIRLKTELSDKQKELEESEKRFAEIYIENNGKDFTGSQELYPQALQALIDGDRKRALAILERQNLLEHKAKLDKEKQQQASSWLLRADLLKAEDNWGSELDECYEYAAEINSNWLNNLRAANHFQFLNQFDKASQYYDLCLNKAESDNEKAATLNDLANLMIANNEFDQAEKFFQEALKLIIKLYEINPQTYLPKLAITLNNFANLKHSKNQFEESEKLFQQSLEILKELVRVYPQTYSPDLAMTLNNYAKLLYSKNESNKAEQSGQNALDIYQKLAEINPQTYLPYVAITLNNLAILLMDKNAFEKAEQCYQEALEIRRKLAKDNPQSYLADVAATLINLGILFHTKNALEQTEQSYEEALEIYQKLAEVNLQAYLPNIATTLNNLATVKVDKNEFEEAEQSYHEALEIYQKLAEVNPQIYLPDVANTKINLAVYYQESKPDKALSIQLIDEAITILMSFMRIPYIKNYLVRAFSVLEDWEIDIVAYAKKTRASIS